MATNKLKNRVLRRKADFENLKRTGRRYSPTKWLIVNYQKNAEASLRFGITISGKVGNSVTRNRLKRWCRDYFRQALKEVGGDMDRGLDINVVFKPVSTEFYRKIEHQELRAALDRFFKNI